MNKRKKQRLDLPGTVRRGCRAAVLALTTMTGLALNVFASGDPIGVVNNLSDFIFGLIRAVGLILLGWGIVHCWRREFPAPLRFVTLRPEQQVGLSFDTSC